MAGVVHEAHLLELGLLHLAEQPVEGDLNAAQVAVAGGDGGGVDARALDGLLERGHLVGLQRHGVGGGRRMPYGLCRHGKVIEGLERAAHAAGVREEVEEPQDLAEQPKRNIGGKEAHILRQREDVLLAIRPMNYELPRGQVCTGTREDASVRAHYLCLHDVERYAVKGCRRKALRAVPGKDHAQQEEDDDIFE